MVFLLVLLASGGFHLSASCEPDRSVRKYDIQRVAFVPPPIPPLTSAHREAQEPGEDPAFFVQLSGNPVFQPVDPRDDGKPGDSSLYVAESLAEVKVTARQTDAGAVSFLVQTGLKSIADKNLTSTQPVKGADALWGVGVLLEGTKEQDSFPGGPSAILGLPLYFMPYSIYEGGKVVKSGTGVQLPVFLSLGYHFDLRPLHPFLGINLATAIRNNGIDPRCEEVYEDGERQGGNCHASKMSIKAAWPQPYLGMDMEMTRVVSVLTQIFYSPSDRHVRGGPGVSFGVRSKIE